MLPKRTEIKSKTFGLIYLHQKGLFRADMTGASIQPIDQNKMDGFGSLYLFFAIMSYFLPL